MPIYTTTKVGGKMLSDVTSGLPVHDVCREIVERLSAKHWETDAARVDRNMIVGNLNNTVLLPEVWGEDFYIGFGVWGEDLFPVRLVTPGTEVNFWPSEHSRSLTVNRYAYTDWERDKRWFIDTPHKYHGREHGLLRYLPYKSKCDCSDLDGAIFEGIAPLVAFMRGEGEIPPKNTLHEHDGAWRCPLLVFSDHYRSEYEPVAGEPSVLRTEDVLGESKEWLETHLLPIL